MSGLRLQPDASRLTLGRFLDDVAERHGARCALRSPERSLSYAELAEEARALARDLAGAGVGKGTRVGLWMANRPEWAVALFAAARLGAVLVPVNTFASAEERDHVLRHGDVALLLMQPTLLQRDLYAELLADHPELGEGVPGRLRCPALPQLRRVACLGEAAGRASWERLTGLGEDVSDDLVDATCAEVEPGDDALVVYTSGTTALPKGILHSQRAPVIQSWRFAELMGLAAEDRVFTAQPFFWTAGLSMSLGSTLAAGACLLLDETFDAGAALARMESEGATALHAWPHQEKQLAEHPSLAERDLSRLRKIEFSSPLADAVGLEKNVWGIHASYGMSETFTICAALPASAPAELRQRSHGVALPGMRIRILDPETGEALPAGQAGEIAVQGATLMRGYLKVPAEQVFDEAGFFRTGDGGSLDAEGHLHWTGRLTNLIKTGGANVSPEEIETKLREHPELSLAVAVGLPHPTLGEIVVLCAVPAPSAAPREEDLRAYLRERLAAYKVPRRVLFFRREEMPVTGTQKLKAEPLREAALRRMAEEGAEIEGHRYTAAAS